MKKIIFLLITVLIFGGILFFTGRFSFLGLQSAILSEDNCSSSLLQSQKTDYDRYKNEILQLNNYITLNNCEINGQINSLGKNQFEVAACQRKINLRKNKTDFTTGYETCQNGVNMGPRLLSGTLGTDVGSTYRTLLDQEENEDMHLNESVYSVVLRSQGESNIKELVYEMVLSSTNNNPDIHVAKAELTSSVTGTYACSQGLNSSQPSDITKKSYLITCRAVGDGFSAISTGQPSSITVGLNLSITTITATGSGTIKFVSGKYATPSSAEEKAITRIAGVTEGVLKYVLAYVDSRDLTVDLVAQSNTSATTIPVVAQFNKLINISSVSTDDFVITGDVTVNSLRCENVVDNENALRTVCTIILDINTPNNPANITIDLPADRVQDLTRGTPKNNLAATQKTISYVYGAPKIVVGTPCTGEPSTCSGIDNTPQLLVYAAVGNIPTGTPVSLYSNTTCSGTPIQSISTTREMGRVDMYERNSLSKNETRMYSVKIGNNCSSKGTTSGKQASYTYTGETIAQFDRLSCMSTTTFQYSKISLTPFIANNTPLCDAQDMVNPKKCNAWQGNGTFNAECLPTGQGTLNHPYRICTPEQLQEMDNAVGKHFRLGKNIDLALSLSWFGGKGFQPIAHQHHFGFSGSLDGNGFEIRNLTIKNPENRIGLFGAIGGASYPGAFISNLKINSATIQNPDTIAGTVSGYAGCAILSGVEATGINMTGVSGNSGGLIGVLYGDTRIFYSKVQGTLSTKDVDNIHAVGGMVGSAPQYLEIRNSESSVNMLVRGYYLGGLVGQAYGTSDKYLEIHDNIIKGNLRIKGSSQAIGGVFGNITHARVSNNSAIPGSNKIVIDGNGTSMSVIGGFAGQVSQSVFSNNTTKYSIQGNASGTVGGFAGRIDHTAASKNFVESDLGGDNSKGPFGYYIGGFSGFGVGGSFTDNYVIANIYLNHDSLAWYIGGFSGSSGGSTHTRNYVVGNTTVNHVNDGYFGGFIGYVGDYTLQTTTPYILTDNFSSMGYVDTVGLAGAYPDYFGGFIGHTQKKPADIVENNYYTNSNHTCTSVASPDKPTCSPVTGEEIFHSPTHAVYTRANNSWDFTNTWKEVAGGLPVLR